MKSHRLVEIRNVVGANKALKSLLARNRLESVGLGLFYGPAGYGKTRYAFKTCLDNGFVYLRLESNATPKAFLKAFLTKLTGSTQPYHEIKGTQNEIYSKILDILQNNQDLVVFLDEIDYSFRHKRILASVRDFIDQSLATIVLVGMEQAKNKLRSMSPHFFDRAFCFYNFKELTIEDAELLIKEVCEVSIDKEILKYIYSKCNGTMRILNRFLESLERIGKRLKKTELVFDEIKDIISKIE